MQEPVSASVIIASLCLGAALILALAALGWLNLSRSERARKWRNSASSTPEPHPHMHIVDGVVITHSHAHGEASHEHKEITISMAHYAALARKAQNQDTV